MLYSLSKVYKKWNSYYNSNKSQIKFRTNNKYKKVSSKIASFKLNNSSKQSNLNNKFLKNYSSDTGTSQTLTAGSSSDTGSKSKDDGSSKSTVDEKDTIYGEKEEKSNKKQRKDSEDSDEQEIESVESKEKDSESNEKDTENQDTNEDDVKQDVNEVEDDNIKLESTEDKTDYCAKIQNGDYDNCFIDAIKNQKIDMRQLTSGIDYHHVRSVFHRMTKYAGLRGEDNDTARSVYRSFMFNQRKIRDNVRKCNCCVSKNHFIAIPILKDNLEKGNNEKPKYKTHAINKIELSPFSLTLPKLPEYEELPEEEEELNVQNMPEKPSRLSINTERTSKALSIIMPNKSINSEPLITI